MGVLSQVVGLGRRFLNKRRFSNEEAKFFYELGEIVKRYETDPILQSELLSRLGQAREVNNKVEKNLLLADTQKSLLNICEHINNSYNPCLSNVEKWVSLKVKLIRYSYEKEKLLIKLKDKVSKEQLAVEENLLNEFVGKFRPGNNWYREKNTFQEEWFKACDVIEMKLQNLEKEVPIEKKGLAEIWESAQTLRSSSEEALEKSEVCLRR